MFVIVKERKVWWPVAWNVPLDGGKFKEIKIDMQFMLLGTDDGLSLTQDAAAIDTDDDPEGRPLSLRKADFLLRFVCDWKGLGQPSDDDPKRNVPLDFSRDALAMLMNMPATFQAVIEAYQNCLAGRTAIRAKN